METDRTNAPESPLTPITVFKECAYMLDRLSPEERQRTLEALRVFFPNKRLEGVANQALPDGWSQGGGAFSPKYGDG